MHAALLRGGEGTERKGRGGEGRAFRLSSGQDHTRDNRPTTNDVTTQPISISASFIKVK